MVRVEEEKILNRFTIELIQVGFQMNNSLLRQRYNTGLGSFSKDSHGCRLPLIFKGYAGEPEVQNFLNAAPSFIEEKDKESVSPFLPQSDVKASQKLLQLGWRQVLQSFRRIILE